jgi:hypothetical protein
MRRRLPAGAARAAKAVRGLWPDRNPLRRGLDRVEALLVGVLAVAFLAGAPLAAMATARLAYSTGSRVAAAEASWRQVPAVLLASAPSAMGASVRARWTAPDGVRRTGTISVPPGQRAGSTVMLWVDASGRVTGQPLERGQVGSQAVTAAVLAVAVLGSVLLCVGVLAHSALDRRRLAAWELDWQLTEPRWTWQG